MVRITNVSKRRRNPLRVDPTRTALLRRAWLGEVNRVFKELAAKIWHLVVTEDAFGLRRRKKADELDRRFARDIGSEVKTTPLEDLLQNQGPSEQITLIFDLLQGGSREGGKMVHNERWAFRTTQEQIDEFEAWLQAEFAGEGGLTNPQTWDNYIERGVAQGSRRAIDDYVAARQRAGLPPLPDSEVEFLRMSFAQPVALEKVQLLAGRVLTELEGVGEDMARGMKRVLADSLVRGDSPRTAARTLRRQLGISKRRAETIARTELIRSHADGQLIALSQAGVEQVGVMVEWRTVGDDRVCPLCLPMESVTLTLKEAQGMIPRHPNCRCAWVPSVVKDPAAKIEKQQIDKAISDSAKAETRKGSIKEARQKSRWTGVDKRIKQKRPDRLLFQDPATRRTTTTTLPEEAPLPQSSSPKKPYIINHTGDTPKEFRDSIEEALDRVDDEIHRKVKAKRGNVATGDHITEYSPEMAELHPRGFPDDWTWDTTNGYYHSEHKEAVTTWRRLEKGPGTPMKPMTNAYSQETVLHEYGHAVDDLLGQGGQSISSEAEFLQAYLDDVAAMNEYERTKWLAYYTQPPPAGPQEAFAQLFAEIHGSGGTKLTMRMPKTRALIEKRLQELAAKGGG